jgi:hypothetical protein
MGLFDFIKKNPSVDTSNLPRFENYGQSPESFSNFQFSRNENTINATNPTKFSGKSASEEVRSATDMAMSKPQENLNSPQQYNGEDVFAALLKKNYEENEAPLKRQRAADFWGNFAKLFGQTVASSAGARNFSPVNTNTAYYNQALDKLRNSYTQSMLNYSLANAKADRDAKLQVNKIQLQFEKDKAMAEIQAQLKGGLIDKQAAANLSIQIQKSKDAKELQGIRDKASMQRTRYSQGAQTERQKMSNDAAMEREKYRQQEITKRNGSSGSSGKKKNKTYPKMKFGSDGDVTYDLNKDTDVARMYNEGVRIGYFPEPINDPTKKGMTIDEMREAILTSTDDVRPIRRTGKKTIEGFSSSSEKNNKKTIEGF